MLSGCYHCQGPPAPGHNGPTVLACMAATVEGQLDLTAGQGACADGGHRRCAQSGAAAAGEPAAHAVPSPLPAPHARSSQVTDKRYERPQLDLYYEKCPIAYSCCLPLQASCSAGEAWQPQHQGPHAPGAQSTAGRRRHEPWLSPQSMKEHYWIFPPQNADLVATMLWDDYCRHSVLNNGGGPGIPCW